MGIHEFRREEEYVGKRVMEVTGKRTREDRSGDGWITSKTTCRRERVVSGGSTLDRV